ncbi:hypothetical protein NA56DRAFT_756520 [Hyaloscypha hepaticicola]|uniref:Uncharacterized protein n=1 Tax=Hyaloscypha hepaticicola TaxID=2082293 RepID=A0A2J6PEP6_9HELO|nr:hypothetical protein NA56DRAFT_756520 [Hyaloscypha hepaticicola]
MRRYLARSVLLVIDPILCYPPFANAAKSFVKRELSLSDTTCYPEKALVDQSYRTALLPRGLAHPNRFVFREARFVKPYKLTDRSGGSNSALNDCREEEWIGGPEIELEVWDIVGLEVMPLNCDCGLC